MRGAVGAESAGVCACRYGTDAIRVICRYGFDQMRLHGISLWVVPENEAARHVYKKLGFVEEGRECERFRRDGRWYDLIVMSMLEGELVDEVTEAADAAAEFPHRNL